MKKVTNLGKRVGMIVIVSDTSSIGVVIKDEQYIQDGLARKSLKVYSVIGNRMSTKETTLGKVMAEVNSSSKVYFVLVDDNYASKLSRQGNTANTPDNSDKYSLHQFKDRHGRVEHSSRTNFMDNARFADIKVDIDKTSPLMVLAKIVRAEKHQHRDITFVKGNQEYTAFGSSNVQDVISKIDFIGVQEFVVIRNVRRLIRGTTPDDSRLEYYNLVLDKQGNFNFVK